MKSTAVTYHKRHWRFGISRTARAFGPDRIDKVTFRFLDRNWQIFSRKDRERARLAAEAYRLRHEEHMTLSQIGERLGVSRGVASNLIKEAMQ
jgi:hypothetical protein